MTLVTLQYFPAKLGGHKSQITVPMVLSLVTVLFLTTLHNMWYQRAMKYVDCGRPIAAAFAQYTLHRSNLAEKICRLGFVSGV
jgi:hypothetical protein